MIPRGIRRGTTPINRFTMPFDLPEGAEYRIVYAQGEDHAEKILFELTTERCAIEGRRISVKLTQEETLLFDCTIYEGRRDPLPVKIQIGIEVPGEDVIWSEIMVTTVGRCLRKDGAVCDG